MKIIKPTHFFKPLFYCFILYFFSCTNSTNTNKNNKTDTLTINKDSAIKNTFFHLKKLSITGDFDGDGKIDTLCQNTINELTKQPIDSFPDSQWNSIENYFGLMNSDVQLFMSNKPNDTLHLGAGGSLYCLINIGDNNKDNKDEIAVVVDYYDFTNISTCVIYSLCGNKWNEIKSFKVFESAFDYEVDSMPNFKQINGYLEYRKNKWYYIDYTDWFNAETDKDTILKPLIIKKCNE